MQVPYTPKFSAIFYLFLHMGTTYCDVFTALLDLTDVIETENHLITALEDYVKTEEHRLELLKRYAELYRKHHDRASEDVESYVSNPINAFILVKKLTSDWEKVEALISADVSGDYMDTITSIKETMTFPKPGDLSGAAVALTRLQVTYKLDTSSLARGEVNGVKYGTELTSADCFELGRQSYDREDYHHTMLWMKEADDRLDSESNGSIERSDILEYLAYSTYRQGNTSLALDYTNKLLEILPTHPRAEYMKIYYEDELQKSNHFNKNGDLDKPQQFKSGTNCDGYLRIYEALCRGELSPPIKVTSQLSCSFVDHGSPFLLLAPFKVEEVYLNPNIYIFHDVISDAEIETVKRLSKHRFERSSERDPKTGEMVLTPYRTSKSAWLKEEEHKHIADISKRVTDMTMLSVESAEALQVVNYGIGGHYEPHFDFAMKNENLTFEELKSGNRIATVLFYMSDVAQGGATVFPNIMASVWPKKGTAVFWLNLHDSGEGDIRTSHGACPVLAGSKWISTKWMHEKYQEFLRPCSLVRPPTFLTA